MKATEIRWLYDPATGLVVNKVYTDSSSVAYTCTPDGKLLRTTWARGEWREHAYIPEGLPSATTTTYSDATPAVSLVYDAFQRLASATNAVASYVYANSALGIATNETATIGGNTDYSWTAGTILGFSVGDGSFAETGYAAFTGRPLTSQRHIDYDGRSADGYYDQTKFDQSFNRSEWFFRYVRSGSAAGLSFSTLDWLNGQHRVHDGSFPFWGALGSPGTPRFIHDERRLSLLFDWYMPASKE